MARSGRAYLARYSAYRNTVEFAIIAANGADGGAPARCLSARVPARNEHPLMRRRRRSRNVMFAHLSTHQTVAYLVLCPVGNTVGRSFIH